MGGARPLALAFLAALSALHLALLPSLSSAQKCSFKNIADLKISPITSFQAVNGKLFLMDRSDIENSRFRVKGVSIHAVEYDIRTNKVRPMATATNTWCSAGGYLPDGTLVNTGGNDEGVKSVRVLRPCGVPTTSSNPPGPCNEWWEDPEVLVMNETRWYPASAILPTGELFVLGGGDSGGFPNIPNWELIQPFVKKSNPSVPLDFLKSAEPNYLYPFLFLTPYNKLFIFANTKGIIYDYITKTVVADIPEIPDKKSRQYISTGSAIMLPLYHTDYTKVEVLICGGSDIDAFDDTVAADSCYRIDISEVNIGRFQWQGLEKLARPRVMPDMLYLLDGTILIIGGMQRGYAGFGTSSVPNRSPEFYRPNLPYGSRINSSLGCSSSITRSYHSEATLVPDGRVLLTGGNLADTYDRRLTQYSLEEFRPHYLASTIPRPGGMRFASSNVVAYGQSFAVAFSYPSTDSKGRPVAQPSTASIAGALIAPAVVTHSNSYNLRYLTLAQQGVVGTPATRARTNATFTATFSAPTSSSVAPPGYYMFTLTHNGLPATPAIWLLITRA